jgi:hypothetical protein
VCRRQPRCASADRGRSAVLPGAATSTALPPSSGASTPSTLLTAAVAVSTTSPARRGVSSSGAWHSRLASGRFRRARPRRAGEPGAHTDSAAADADAPELVEAVERVAEGGSDPEERLKARKEAAVAVLRSAREHGTVSKRRCPPTPRSKAKTNGRGTARPSDPYSMKQRNTTPVSGGTGSTSDNHDTPRAAPI